MPHALDRSESEFSVRDEGHQRETKNALALAPRYLHGQWVMLLTRFRHRRFVYSLRSLAQYLEAVVFPVLRREGQQELTLTANDKAKALIPEGCAERFKFPGTEHIATTFIEQGIQRVSLDSRLEAGQIVETFLIACHAAPCLKDVTPATSSYDGWNRRRVASALVSSHGYNKFCALMRFDREAATYRVVYSYCELFFSRTVRHYVEHGKRFQDHRLLFHLVPRATFLTAAALMIPVAILLQGHVLFAALVLTTEALAGALAVGFALFAMGSFLYTREHHDTLIQGYLEHISILSRFPEVNPNPIFKLSHDGELLYTNPSGKCLLSEQDNVLGAALPGDYMELISKSLAEGMVNVCETHVGKQVLRYQCTPFPDERSVILTGTDVSYLKQMECELRDLNRDLEEKVIQRSEELHRTQDVTIMCLAGLAETRDPETGEHLYRTRLYVKELANYLANTPRFQDELSEDMIELIYKSTPLHDIGKVGVPDAILLKPGKLTASEFEEMKKHAQYGGDALRLAEQQLGFDSFLSVARDIAYHHHEKWDGSGYPHGLAGEDISCGARLMALADVYDALRTKRVYKDAFSHEKARAIIVEGRGTHFDPEIVDAFLELEARFCDIAERYADVVETA